MALRALLFSRDPEIIRLVAEVLNALEIELTQSSVAQETVQRLGAGRFDAILVDNADASGAVVVLSAAKNLPSCQESIGIVLAVSRNSIGLAQGARSHMVLYRPLSANRLRNGVRSALGLRAEGEDARESHRASTNIPATLHGIGVDDTLIFITNLSAGGAALKVGASVSSSSIQSIEFSLPDSAECLTTAVELVWRDVEGRIGVSFAHASPAFRATLEKWLASQPAPQRAAQAGA